MPRKKRTVTEETVEDTPGTASSTPAEHTPDPEINTPAYQNMIDAGTLDPAEQDLQNFFEGLPGECVIKIQKIDAQGRARFVTEMPPSDFSELLLQESFGEGKYRLLAYDGDKRYRGTRSVLIAAPATKPNLGPSPIIAPIGPDPLLTSEIQNIKSEQTTMRDLMFRLVDKIGSNGGNERQSFLELAEAMKMLKETVQPPPADSPMKLFAEIVPLVKSLIELGGGVPAEKGWIGTLKEVLAELPALMKGIAMQRQQTEPLAPVVNPPAQIAPSKVGVVESIPAESAAMLRQAIGFLKSRARLNQNPDDWVAWVMNTLDAPQSEQVARLLDRPFEEVAQIDPEISGTIYRAWFEQFFGGLKDALLSQRDDSTGEAGNPSDLTSHEGTDSRVIPFGPPDKGKGSQPVE